MKLLARNLARTTTEAELKTLFETYGKVQYCTLATDKDTGNSKGFAFIEMPSPGDARAAVKNLNGKDLAGSKIRVKKAESKKPEQAESKQKSPEAEKVAAVNIDAEKKATEKAKTRRPEQVKPKQKKTEAEKAAAVNIEAEKKATKKAKPKKDESKQDAPINPGIWSK